LAIDRRLLELRQVVSQRAALYDRDASDVSLLLLSRARRRLLAANAAALIQTDAEQDWWRDSQAFHLGRVRQRFMAAAATLIVLLLTGLWGYKVYRQVQRDRLRSDLLQAVSNQRPNYQGLLDVTERFGASAWRDNSGWLGIDDLSSINPDNFVSEPFRQAPVNYESLLTLIDVAHPLFMRSRELFGAMSYALEETALRSQDSDVVGRAKTLAETVRRAFIEVHRRDDPRFQAPPAIDPLNEFVPVRAGTFTMGASSASDPEAGPDETEHVVSLSAFRMQRHEVTNQEYQRFDPTHRFDLGRERHPVSEYEAQAYAAWLGASLPSEAQWEYAARGTEATGSAARGRRYPWGGEALSDDRAAYNQRDSSPVGTHSLGRTPPPESLDDMAGNVFEWCRDWYDAYDPRVRADPLGPSVPPEDNVRVLRGGSFVDLAGDLRAAHRFRSGPDFRYDGIGFRLVSSRLRP
jgi:formylglycine-generating enzyme required for sulfatase activity